MKKHKNKRQLAVLTVVFALTLLTAFAYAAGNGTLKFSGTAAFVATDEELSIPFYV